MLFKIKSIFNFKTKIHREIEKNLNEKKISLMINKKKMKKEKKRQIFFNRN